MNLYRFGKAVTYLFTIMLFRIKYEGLENIPGNKGFILASNHITAYDPIIIAHKIPRPLHFMAKAELFKNPLFGWVLRHVNAFPVDRGKGDGTALDEARLRIEGGGVLGIFIEGTRSKDGKPQRARSGVSLIAGKTGADILPCAVVYDKEKLKFRSAITIRYGKLIKNDTLGINPEAPSTLRLAAKSVMNEIVGLIGGDDISGGDGFAG